MRSISRLAGTAILLAFAPTPPVFAQIVDHLTDAPFTGSFSRTVRSGTATTPTSTAQMTRASNGSTYVSYTASGKNYLIRIEDVPNNRVIWLNPLDHTYRVSPAPGGKFRTMSVQRNTRMLQELQDSYVQEPDRLKPDGNGHEIALGVKQEDGMTIFGHTEEFTSTTGKKRTAEVWFSDLGVVVRERTVWPAEDRDSVSSVTDIRRQEPDPKLFQIPEEYRAYDHLLEAKTVFILNQTGSREITDGASQAFTDSKRLTVVNSMESADLIATFTPATELTGERTIPFIRMSINRPASETVLFQTGMRTIRIGPDSSVSLADSSVAKGCVDELIKKMQDYERVRTSVPVKQ